MAGCQDPILSSFFGKILFCPIFWEMSYFILIFGHFTQEHSLKIFSLASLGIKILFVHIVLEPFLALLSHCVYMITLCKPYIASLEIWTIGLLGSLKSGPLDFGLLGLFDYNIIQMDNYPH